MRNVSTDAKGRPEKIGHDRAYVTIQTQLLTERVVYIYWSMRMMDYREILRLRSLGFSQRQLEREKIVGREKSKEIFQAADMVGICWPLDDDVTNGGLELRFFPDKYSAVSMYVEPDYPYIHRELAKHGGLGRGYHPSL